MVKKNKKSTKKGKVTKVKAAMELWDEDKFYAELNKVVNAVEAKLDKLVKFAHKRTIKDIPVETKTNAFLTSFEVINDHIENCEAQVSGDNTAMETNIRDLVNAKRE